MREPFGARLHALRKARGPLCVGIDPHAGLLQAWGLPDDASGLERFALTVVEALAEQVAAFKPQSAFFERHGARGIAVLERVLAATREAGALSVLDVKRGDVSSTVEAYAQAYLDPASPLYADALTASPYLGFGSLRPFVDTALAHGGGVFVLALTSNPEGASVQRAVGPNGRSVAGGVLDAVRELNRDSRAAGSIGVVVGATVGESGEDLRVGGPLLAPGLGAQGASAADLRAVFGPALPDVLPSTSREVLRAGPSPRALQEAAGRASAAYAAVLAAGR